MWGLSRLQRWARDKTLSFVPPDGRFKLMEYRYVPASASNMHQVAVPIALRNTIQIQEHGGKFNDELAVTNGADFILMAPSGTFDLTLSSRLTTRAIESVIVELFLGEGASGASCMASHNASWGFDLKTLVRTIQIFLTFTRSNSYATESEMGTEKCSTINESYPPRLIHIYVSALSVRRGVV